MSTDEKDRAGVPPAGDPALAATLPPSETGPAAVAPPRPESAGDPGALAVTLQAAAVEPLGAPGKTIAEATPHGSFSLPADLATVDRNHYDVLEEFARGGLGRILRAGDRRTGRVVALKEVLDSSGDADGRLAREALLTAHLEHPGIVPVYEVGRWPSGEPFYAMKLVGGRPLADVLARARTLDSRLRLVPHVLRVAEALAYAHDHRVIHRDLKPANVMVGDYGETVVLDWGLAKQIDERDDPGRAPAPGVPGQTVIGAVMGTPWYMPPEQAAGQTVDERADVYALGAILYEVLGGEPPFSAATTVDEVLEQARAGTPTPLLRLEPGVPRELLAIVEKAMGRRPEDRYPTARLLAEDLDRFLGGQLVRAHHYTRVELVARWIRRNRTAVVVSLISAVTLALGGTASVLGIVEARDRALGAEAKERIARRVADRGRAQAQERLVDLFVEQGRQKLLQGEPGPALALLTEAQRAGGEGSTLRFLLARAAQPFRNVQATFRAADELILTVGVARRGDAVFAVTHGRQLVLWETAGGRERLREPATSAVFSPDGARLAMASQASVHVIEVETGRRLARLDLGQAVTSLAWSRDGGALGVCGFEGAAALWRTDSFAERFRVQAHGRPCLAGLDLSGARMLTVADDGAAKLWATDGGGLQASLETPGGRQGEARFSPDGSWIATAGADSTVRIFDANGALIARLEGHREAVSSISFAADGARLLSVSRDAAILWDVAASRPSWRTDEPLENLADGALAPAGDTAVLLARDGVARLWDTRRGEKLAEYRDVSALPAFDGDGTVIATGSSDGRLQLRRALQAGDVMFLPHQARAANGSYSPRGDLLATASMDGLARVWDTRSGRLVHTLSGHAGEVSWAAFSPDGKLLVTCGEDGSVRLWDPRGGHLVRELRGHTGRVRRAFFSGDGARLFTAGFDREARSWDTASGRGLVALGRAPWKLWAAVPSASGQILTLGEGALVDLWDGPSGRHLGASVIDATQVLEAVGRPDGAEFAVASTSSDAWLLATNPAVSPRRLRGHVGSVLSVAYSPDGSWLATAGVDGTTRLWSVAEGRLVRVLDRSARPRVSLAFRHDGRVLATAGEDGVARLWEVATGRKLAELETSTQLYVIRFRPDGEQLALFGLDDHARIWNVPSSSVVPLARLDEILRCTVPFRIERGAVVPAPVDPTSCPR